jgi:lipopolysaccharide export system permease protein
VPFLLNLFSPVFVFISVIFFTSKLASRSEIVSLLASGTSYIRLLVLMWRWQLLIAVFSYVLNGWIIPHADTERLEFENTYIRNLENNYTTNVRSQILPGVVMSLQSYNYLDSVGNRISLEHYENGRMISRTTGKNYAGIMKQTSGELWTTTNAFSRKAIWKKYGKESTWTP